MSVHKTCLAMDNARLDKGPCQGEWIPAADQTAHNQSTASSRHKAAALPIQFESMEGTR